MQLWPKAFEVCCANPNSKLSVAQKTNACSFFIGFKIDKLRMKGRDFNLEKQIQLFKDAIHHVQIEGTDLLTNYFTVKQLPPVIFENFYEGGKKEAMEKRAKIRAEDPERIRRKEEAAAAAAAENEDAEDEDEGEGGGEANEVVVEVEEKKEEEDDGLQSALDNIGGKEREQAEAERAALMTGEDVLTEDAKDEEILVKVRRSEGSELHHTDLFDKLTFLLVASLIVAWAP